MSWNLYRFKNIWYSQTSDWRVGEYIKCNKCDFEWTGFWKKHCAYINKVFFWKIDIHKIFSNIFLDIRFNLLNISYNKKYFLTVFPKYLMQVLSTLNFLLFDLFWRIRCPETKLFFRLSFQTRRTERKDWQKGLVVRADSNWTNELANETYSSLNNLPNEVKSSSQGLQLM